MCNNSYNYSIIIIYNTAIIIIIGVLGAVSDLLARPSRHSIQLSWVAPFSLDITDTSLDTWYSLEIAKRTQLQSQLAEIPCDTCSVISETEYTFIESMSSDSMETCSTYEFTIIATNAAGPGRRNSNSTVLSSLL